LAHLISRKFDVDRDLKAAQQRRTPGRFASAEGAFDFAAASWSAALLVPLCPAT
jgi:hypothetical protein